ncbi:MAG TPA: RNA polymerase sigma factor SigI [Acidimicrobiales bacterium]
MATGDGPTDAQFTEAWHIHRPYLVDLAFGMLADIGAAEDAVQEAFARLTRADFERIKDQRGWLIVVTSRICLDQIQSARSRRERAHESSTIEFAGPDASRPTSVDPADRVTLDDEVRLALLVVLERLSPAERVVFVLHDIFQMPFDTIAESVGRTAPACRQLARQARMKIQAEQARGVVEVDTAEHRLVAKQFIRACSDGDLSALLQLLDPEVTGEVDLGPDDPRTGQVFTGSKGVARNLLRYVSTLTLVSNPIGGQTVVLAFVESQLAAVVHLTVQGQTVKKIHVVADPNSLGFLGTRIPPVTRNEDS